MKIFATIVLAMGVLIAAVLFIFFSICAVKGDVGDGGRTPWILADLVDVAIMVILVVLIVRLNRASD